MKERVNIDWFPAFYNINVSVSVFSFQNQYNKWNVICLMFVFKLNNVMSVFSSILRTLRDGLRKHVGFIAI